MTQPNAALKKAIKLAERELKVVQQCIEELADKREELREEISSLRASLVEAEI